ncbi:hypothetical protein BOH78_3568 [Pichia kudriavzevii]|uniref:Uncharacterized protein n=1 Tax=Pichia kudriavzevii TaxID=4909 RepID=A0A1V2LK31_PICKU|nr:hypothetical protein BOH78_3568 [Pichia kudriavzevii]
MKILECTIYNVSLYSQKVGGWVQLEDGPLWMVLVANTPMTVVISRTACGSLLNQVLEIKQHVEYGLKVYFRNGEMAMKYWDLAIGNWGRVQFTMGVDECIRWKRHLSSLQVCVVDKSVKLNTSESLAVPVGTHLSNQEMLRLIQERLRDTGFQRLVCYT